MFLEFLVPSLGVDLLCLHSHMHDPKLLRILVRQPAAESPSGLGTRPATVAMAKRAITSLRGHFGASDGASRSRSTSTAPTQPK